MGLQSATLILVFSFKELLQLLLELLAESLVVKEPLRELLACLILQS